MEIAYGMSISFFQLISISYPGKLIYENSLTVVDLFLWK